MRGANCLISKRKNQNKEVTEVRAKRMASKE